MAEQGQATTNNARKNIKKKKNLAFKIRNANAKTGEILSHKYEAVCVYGNTLDCVRRI